MKNFEIKGMSLLSKADQRSVIGGDHLICCYKACVNSGNPAGLCQIACFY